MHRFNIFTWLIVIIYLTVIATMQYFSPAFSFENIYISLPLIVALIICSENTRSIQIPDNDLTKTERFFQDCFLISYSFIAGNLLSLLFQYNNSDVLGWWPITIYFSSLIGVLFAIMFSLFAIMLNIHKKYTLVYSVILVLVQMFISFMMHLNPLSIFARDKTYYAVFLFLIGMHLFICLSYIIKNRKTV